MDDRKAAIKNTDLLNASKNRYCQINQKHPAADVRVINQPMEVVESFNS
ncbi:hypothetical protein SynBIOSE41_04413 [Synechococcus sp. BIOS-E4-1]|nr:hypothetical protein SynBIOSE41_04413 [Synechococcus sp. BIOS-E4-1]